MLFATDYYYYIGIILVVITIIICLIFGHVEKSERSKNHQERVFSIVGFTLLGVCTPLILLFLINKFHKRLKKKLTPRIRIF
jgi:hypothetical protein